ncbi:cryptochrome/photolyase family protein [Arenicella xantha]|uniref:Deoxyribodipyrimidine photo-lyase n=1 Tax=Arenicella xantha TaxID=644221 RepID=A0A395JEY4_9GAMM|nr:deoxyribodipyrimidine photo-lyase [Arenicella xantha]RBP48308.1 deoxyribodipyrimidine photo-lyase [Arenicella xantha]
MKTLVWFREDLRLHDNPALYYAARSGEVMPVFIYPSTLGEASYWWLHHSLLALSDDLAKHGVTLTLATGDPASILAELALKHSADKVVWNRVYSPDGIQTGKAVKTSLQASNIACDSYNGQLLIEPTTILTKQGTPFKVFTPFWRNCMAQLDPPEPLGLPTLNCWHDDIGSETLSDWGLLPSQPDWSGGLAERWQPGESGAQARWERFLEEGIQRYKNGRDIPSRTDTSMLSPHLAFGEISVRQLWFDIQQAMADGSVSHEDGMKYLSELGWREFSRYLLVHFPHVLKEPFNARFTEFPWDGQSQQIDAWKQGKTGYPIVDAGMRELWHTGFMHNRVRMICASFLTKHLRTHWQVGADWFWDTLVDADIANNTASWQWVAGCGADAAPYFRIFNPILQGEKFDKQGDYIKHWVPELEQLGPRYLNKPWEADTKTLLEAGITLGDNYPFPIVEHKAARIDALAAYQAIKNA